MTYFIQHYGTQILLVVLCAVFGVLGHGLRQLVNKYLTDATKKAVAKTAVLFVEQIYKTIHGEEKLNAAMEAASELLEKKGITCDTDEMRILLEAALAEFNNAFSSDTEGSSLEAIGFNLEADTETEAEGE